MVELWPNMYPLVAKKWTKQKSDPAIQTACQKEAYPESFIIDHKPNESIIWQPGSKVCMTFYVMSDEM